MKSFTLNGEVIKKKDRLPIFISVFIIMCLSTTVVPLCAFLTKPNGFYNSYNKLVEILRHFLDLIFK